MLDQSNWGKRLLQKSSDGVLDTGIYKNAFDQGKLDAKLMFKAFTENRGRPHLRLRRFEVLGKTRKKLYNRL